MKRLGVNIDHVATLRNARGEVHPSPLQAAKLAIKYGADSITLHLREDRRHIKDKDLTFIEKTKKKWGYHRLDYEDTIKFLCQNFQLY